MKISDIPTNEYIESLAVKIGQDPYHVDDNSTRKYNSKSIFAGKKSTVNPFT